jgi:hypothetical protein
MYQKIKPVANEILLLVKEAKKWAEIKSEREMRITRIITTINWTVEEAEIITNFHFISSFGCAHVFGIKKFTLFNNFFSFSQFLASSYAGFFIIVGSSLHCFCILIFSERYLTQLFVICIWFLPHVTHIYIITEWKNVSQFNICHEN